MMKSLNLLIPATIVAGAVALALYAMPRAYQDLTPGKFPVESPVPTTELVATGNIRGRVVWNVALPEVPPIEGMIIRHGSTMPRWDSVPNPAAPKIDAETKGIADTVVYLKEVGTSRKIWPYPTTTIKMIDGRVVLNQGNDVKPIVFIPLGGEVEIVSRDFSYQMLRARGAAFFTLPLPRPNRSEKRKFDRAGHIAFTSATGYIGSEADAFVCEHPYYALTDAGGRFELTNVPPGEYEIAAWLKNWTVLSKDRDPETAKIMRLNFDKPFTNTGRVNVIEGRTAEVNLKLP